MKKEIIITLIITVFLFAVAVLSFTFSGGWSKAADSIAKNNAAQYDAADQSGQQQDNSAGDEAGDSSTVTSSAKSAEGQTNEGKILTEAEKKKRVDSILKDIDDLKE